MAQHVTEVTETETIKLGVNQVYMPDGSYTTTVILFHNILTKMNLLINDTAIKAIGRPPTFNQEMEAILVEESALFHDWFFRLTNKDLQKMAFDMAEMFNIPNTFNQELRMASTSWVQGFLRRNQTNPRLVIPYRQSKAPWELFNCENICKFLDTLEKKIPKVVGEKIFIITQLDKMFPNTVNGTVSAKIVIAFGAIRQYVPPLIVIEGDVCNWNRCYHPNYMLKITKDGEITEEIFLAWLEEIKPIIANYDPTLLLLDGQLEYAKCLRSLYFAKTNGIVLMQIIGYELKHTLPFQDAFLRAYYKVFNDFQERCQESDYEEVMYTNENIPRIILQAMLRATEAVNKKNIFYHLGIWPYDRPLLFHYLYSLNY